MSADVLLKLNTLLDEGTYDVRSLLIVRDCKLVFERYGSGIGRDHNHTIYSVTKSITATLVGNLLLEGKLKSVDVPIASVVSKPFWFRDGDWKKAERITLKNAMQMSSGLAYMHDPVNNPIYNLQADRFAVALAPDQVAEPGTRFQYSDGDVTLTGAVVAAAADTNLYKFARQALFDPLGMVNHDWMFLDRAGRFPGGWGLRLRPMDMAKVGQLYLQNGEWNGRRIFGPDFRELAWSPGVNKSYALHWWVGTAPEAQGASYMAAIGFKGQRIWVFPTLRIVAVLTSSLPGSEERIVAGSIIRALVEATDKAIGPEDQKAQAALDALQKKGFQGQTRIFQADQDWPSR